MNTSWILILVGLAVTVAVAVSSRLRRRAEVDLGAVSHQWITEQRFGTTRDPRR
ncbi:MAG: hypothetical protein HYU37_02055 [Acidobacteria bacterium]|nr:hypothetical protein [Acidobacteriota bacterium]